MGVLYLAGGESLQHMHRVQPRGALLLELSDDSRRPGLKGVFMDGKVTCFNFRWKIKITRLVIA